MTRRRMQTAGFTLIEMLVSLALLGMASLMLADELALGHRVSARSEARISAGEGIESAQNLIRDRLERLQPLTRFDGTTPFVELEGAPAALKFLAPPPQSQGPSPPRRFKLSRTSSGDLVLASIDGFAPDDDRNYRAVVLLRGIQQLDIAYFGPLPTGRGGFWQTIWSQRSVPPAAVRVRIAFAAGDRRVWPDLIVRPAATIDTQCSLDKLGRCVGRA